MIHAKLTGQDLHAPSEFYIENNSGSTLPAFRLVRLNGFGTVYPQVVLNNGTVASFGLTLDPIPTGKRGFVYSLGLVYGTTENPLNSSAWLPNTTLYCSNTGTLTDVVNGVPIGYVVKQDAVYGVVFVTAINGTLLTLSGDWGIGGNAGVTPLNFLGTTDSAPLKFKTNNQPVGQFDNAGRFGIGAEAPLEHFYHKTHAGYTNSGIRKATIAVNTTTSSFENAFDIQIPDNALCSVKFHVMGRQSNGSERCVFTRSGLFYRQGSNVMSENAWQSDLTIRSSPIFTVSNLPGVSTLSLRVRNSSGNLTYWVGYVEYQILTTDL